MNNHQNYTMVSRTLRQPEKSIKQHTKAIFGHSISPGLAIGKAFLYRDILPQDSGHYQIEPAAIEGEFSRVAKARSKVLQNLDVTARRVESNLDESQADIFRAQALMLGAPEIMDEIRQRLERELHYASQVVRKVFAWLERQLGQADDPLFCQRADDIADLARRLLRALSGTHWHTLETLPAGSVVVTDRLLASDTVMLPARFTAAVIMETGGPASHAALLAREMGIPAVAQVAKLLDLVNTDDLLFVDGVAGRVVVRPDEASADAFEARRFKHTAVFAQAYWRRDEPARTLDGNRIHVLANISTPEDAMAAANSGAEGVGLYRIESLYQSRKMPPTRDELTEALLNTLSPLESQSITVCLLDIGGDKIPPFLHLPSGADSFLGRRGVRILLDYPDLLLNQLHALLSLSREFDLRISVPMVTLLSEFEHVKALLRTTATERGMRNLPRLGVMIETPAAALCIEAFAKAADFIELGTNDLTQYTMVAGREDASVRSYYLENHPAMQRLINMVMQGAGGKPVILCGELANRTESLKWILETGIEILSVAPPFVPIVKAAVRAIRLSPANLYFETARPNVELEDANLARLVSSK